MAEDQKKKSFHQLRRPFFTENIDEAQKEVPKKFFLKSR